MAGGEVVLRKPAMATHSQRGRLSNISNIQSSANKRYSDESKLYKSWNEGSVNGSASAHLRHQQEIKILQLALKEKKAEIEGYKATLEAERISKEEMRRDLEASLVRRAQQNDDIIAYTTHMAKEVYFLRDQLRLQQHEHTGMMMAYRISENELQVKLAEVLEQLKAALQEKQSKGSTDGSSKVGRLPEPNTYRRKTMGPGAFVPGLWNSSTKPKSLNDLYSTTSITSRQFVREPKSTTKVPVIPSTSSQVAPRSSQVRHLACMNGDTQGGPTPKNTPCRNLDNHIGKDSVQEDPEKQVTVRRKGRQLQDSQSPISLEGLRTSSMAMAFDRCGLGERNLITMGSMTPTSSQVAPRSSYVRHLHLAGMSPLKEEEDSSQVLTPVIPFRDLDTQLANDDVGGSAVEDSELQATIRRRSRLLEDSQGPLSLEGVSSSTLAMAFDCLVTPFKDTDMSITEVIVKKADQNRSKGKGVEVQPEAPAIVPTLSSINYTTGRPRRKATEIPKTYNEESPDDFRTSLSSSAKGRLKPKVGETPSTRVKKTLEPVASPCRDVIDGEELIPCSKESIPNRFQKATITSKTPGVMRKSGDSTGCFRRESGLQLKTPTPVTASKKLQSRKSLVKEPQRQELAKTVISAREKAQMKVQEGCARSLLTGRPRRRAAEAVVSYVESPA